VHLQHAPEPLLLLLERVVDVVARLDLAAVDAEVGQGADVGIRLDLEGVGGEGRLVLGRAGDGLAVGLVALDGRQVLGRGQEVHHRVEQRLDALVLEGRAAQGGHELARQAALAQRRGQARRVGVLALEEGVHHLVVEVGGRLDHLVAVLDGQVVQLRGDRLLDEPGAERAVVEAQGLHRPQVDDALVVVLDAPGQGDGHRLAARRSRMVCRARRKSAPTRSILLMKAMRGTLYLSACRQTVSLWGCTPATPQNTATAPSRTRRLRSTSMVKSTCPGCR
jgi:hypothetical protein